MPKQEQSLRKQAHNPKKLHVIDPGLISAFKANPGRDVGRKLETAVFLEMRRQGKDLFYFNNGSEIDLCDGDGTIFINSCWSLAEPETRGRELEAMAFGRKRWPHAVGRLLFHEYAAGIEQQVPSAEPAWRFLTGKPNGM